jgi:hypothetical protein
VLGMVGFPFEVRLTGVDVLVSTRSRCPEFVPIFHGTTSSSRYLPKLCY